ncbi:DUF2807 domain-containing protein [Flavobacterium sp. Sd200]|uniref:GIN domain-containing protein n=1 Tax=Flavobacterium sp. Sd200 TaxID=2692211 RepID=UPI0013698AE1|nr:DUF2807 domain-containing protein [Flavobacterium sp. Sd200]MXN92310.1 DUF2807 domain-containing protein [Flavobacterium sp. Sd200]
MKKFSLMLLALLFTTVAFAQKREKIKGSKNVTITQKELPVFETVEIEDNIEVYFIKGSSQRLEIEADDNLHDAIKTEVTATTLRIYCSKEISGAKKMVIRITYIDSLKNITAKHEATIYAVNELELDSITVKNLDFSKSFLNVRSKNFGLIMNDKTKAEVNIKADNTTIELSKNADLKALIASPSVKCDMYQKTTAAIEGDAENVQLRIDNNAVFTGKKFTAKNMELTAESYTKCSILITDILTLSASGKTEVGLYGTPATVTMKKFANNAVIAKKED